MKHLFYFFVALSLLAARGCPSSRPPTARARLIVEAASAKDLSPSAVASLQKAKDQLAVAKVISRAQDPRFQAEVANALGVSPEAVATVVLDALADTRIVYVRADLSDQALAARIVNEVANRLAQDFRANPDINVRVADLARSGAGTGKSEK